MAIKLIIGLGNPTDKYQHNRHNIGFYVANVLADLHHGSWKLHNKFFAMLSCITLDNHKLYIAKPTTYMNNSGKSVAALMKFYSLQPDEILIVHDELDLDLGIIKLKYAGGHGGHNGLRDISHHITPKYFRLRIGIGRPPIGLDVSRFVLSNFSPKEFTILSESILPSIEHMSEIVSNTNKAMQRINTPLTH